MHTHTLADFSDKSNFKCARACVCMCACAHCVYVCVLISLIHATYVHSLLIGGNKVATRDSTNSGWVAILAN